MKNKMKDSSIDAYNKILESLPAKRRAVYAAINELKNCCDIDIAEYLGWPINRVTGRRNELEKLELIRSRGKKLTKHSDIAVYHWEINNNQK